MLHVRFNSKIAKWVTDHTSKRKTLHKRGIETLIINIDLSDKILKKLEEKANANKRSRKAEAEIIIEAALQ